MGIRNFVVVVINYPNNRKAMILFSFRIFIRSNTENLRRSDIIWWRGQIYYKISREQIFAMSYGFTFRENKNVCKWSCGITNISTLLEVME